MSREYVVYILTNKTNGVLYIGVTNNIQRRMFEHKNGLSNGFSKKYNCHMLVYMEQTSDVNAALSREKQLKKWNRQWKIDLIEKMNPLWQDLAAEMR